MKLIYLASPYTSPSPETRIMRRELADRFAARLIDAVPDTAIFSPITHGTRLEPYLPESKVKSHAFWMSQCYPFLRRADELWVLPLPGWSDSKGVLAEIEVARQMELPIYMVQLNYVDQALELVYTSDMERLGVEDIIWLRPEAE